METFNEILVSWQTFYFSAVGAAAALLGLMFVALSLAMPLISPETRDNMKIFVTPSVVYFVSAMLLAFVLLVPAYDPVVFSGLILVGGVVGSVVAVRYGIQLRGAARFYGDFLWYDWLTHVVLPIADYALLLVAGVAFAASQWGLGFASLALATLLLLLTAIANTWNLILWIVDQQKK